MAVIKCKMCGGDILLSEDKTYGVCDSCGSSQTMPRVPDEQRANLFNRANHFRRANEFDKAVSAYEKILDADNTDAEAHWGAVISRFGIEYVEDPVSHEYIPTCHRAQLNPILTDADYLAAVENAPDGYTRGLYEQEAKRISEIQKGILAVSQREEPYDVFICYKETTDGGTRTKDSTIAQEIYFQLTNAGYKVFFSRITLEHKLGTQYEPYIFAALNSARVMLVIGTQPEYFSAVWVRNEWSRYLALMREDPSRLLIPCYRDMDPYDLPEELSAFQSQDMSKIGFMQDLLYGVRKVLDAGKAETRPAASAPAAVSGDIAPLLKRAFMFLEDGEWTSADEYAERVLDKDPENGTAYLAKLMAELRVNKREGLKDQPQPFDDMGHFKKAARFGDAALKRELEDANRHIRQRNEDARLEGIYAAAERAMRGSVSEQQFEAAAACYHQILSYKDSESKEKQCLARAEECRKDVIYTDAVGLFSNAGKNRPQYAKAAEMFKKIQGYKDADEYVLKCEQKSQQIIREEQEAELERKRAEEQRRIAAEKRAKKTKKLAAIIIPAVAVITAVVILFTVIIPNARYNNAIELRQTGKYEEAIVAFEKLGDYKDCKEQLTVTKKLGYQAAVALQQSGKYEEAIVAFETLGDYSDSKTQITSCKNAIMERDYQAAVALQQAGKYDEAIAVFEALGDYKDCDEQITETKYLKAKSLLVKKDYSGAYALFITLKGYKDVDSLIAKDENLKAAAAAAREAKLKPYKTVGSYVTYGTYPQTEAGNDSTPIEWLVLEYDEENNQALLISRYGLDCQPYNSSWTNVTWETCSLRTWLNGTFLNKAFSKAEQGAILTTEVDNSKSQCYSGYSTNGGNNTKDKVFLLSYAEAWKYFKNDEARKCAPTDYAIKQGTWTSSSYKVDGRATCYWWLRSPESYSSACDVYYSGARNCNSVSYSIIAVRPAFWLDLSAIEAENASSAGETVSDHEEPEVGAIEGPEEAVSDALSKQDFTVGSYVIYGTYPQTEAGNDNTPIEWLVLDYDAKNNKALLISRYGLDCQPYNTKYTDVTWETCSLRTWLNGTFLNKAFSKAEQGVILTTEVDNSSQCYSGWSTNGGNNTQDKIFLLSYAEANKYFNVTYSDSNNTKSRVAPTAYAIARGAWTSLSNKTTDGSASGYWWLRSPGINPRTAAVVFTGGSLLSNSVRNYNLSVRPAFWLDLSAIEVEGASMTGETVSEHAESDEGIRELPDEAVSDALSKQDFTVGSYVTYGTYPQTKAGNDSTPIEWLVLEYDAKNNKALLISRYGLDCQKYNNRNTWVTWETCSLRTWLNSTFLNKAFSKAEQGAILTTEVDNSKSQCSSRWNTSGGNNTQDKIFLLSYAEANKYFNVTYGDSNNTKSRVAPTTYAVKQGAYISSSNKTADGLASGYWWLRSPGYYDDDAAYVGTGGSLFNDYVIYNNLSVRPAFWLDLSAIEAENASSAGETVSDHEEPEVGAIEGPEEAVSDALSKHNFTVGSYITYGTYPQTEAGNDNTPIEWLVLDYDAKNNKALLISRYGLDCQPYNTQYTDVTWETCTLRTWLNGTFLNKAFSKAEQGAILTTEVDNSKSQGYYSTNGGKNTQDKVFLLSYAEAWKYFKNDEARKCAPTDYAIKQGTGTSSSNKVDGRATCYWWLRSPGSSSSSAALVDSYGARGSRSVDITYIAVRPAFWLDLSGI